MTTLDAFARSWLEAGSPSLPLRPARCPGGAQAARVLAGGPCRIALEVDGELSSEVTLGLVYGGRLGTDVSLFLDAT